MALDIKNKRDKRLYSAGKAAGSKSAREAGKSDALMEKGALYAGAWAGQKFLGGMMTPGISSIPLSYSVGAVVTILELGGNMGRGKASRYLTSAVDGWVCSDVGLIGRSNQKPLFGG